MYNTGLVLNPININDNISILDNASLVKKDNIKYKTDIQIVWIFNFNRLLLAINGLSSVSAGAYRAKKIIEIIASIIFVNGLKDNSDR